MWYVMMILYGTILLRIHCKRFNKIFSYLASGKNVYAYKLIN